MSVDATIITATIGEQTLSRCIESVQKQSYRKLHHLIVVDGPDFDVTVRHIVKPFIGGDIKIDVIILPFNTGQSIYYGHRIYAAGSFILNSDIIFTLDADNWFDEEHAESCVEALRSSGAQWAYSLRRICSDQGEPLLLDNCDSLGVWPRYSTRLLTEEEDTPRASFLKKYPHLVDTSCFAIRGHLFMSVAPLWVYGHGADSVVATKLVRSEPVVLTGRYTTNYCLSPGTRSSLSYFERGNAFTHALFKGNYPWAKGKWMYLKGPQSYPHQ